MKTGFKLAALAAVGLAALTLAAPLRAADAPTAPSVQTSDTAQKQADFRKEMQAMRESHWKEQQAMREKHHADMSKLADKYGVSPGYGDCWKDSHWKDGARGKSRGPGKPPAAPAKPAQ